MAQKKNKHRYKGPSQPMRYIDRLGLQSAQHRKKSTDFNLQMAQDAMVAAVNEVFGIGSGRIVPLIMTYNKYLTQFTTAIGQDGFEDKEFVYSKSVIDRVVQPIYGNAFVPFDIRYGLVEIDPNSKLNIDAKGKKIDESQGTILSGGDNDDAVPVFTSCH